MKKQIFAITAAASFLLATAALHADVPEQANFVNTWHGVGSDHQAGNNPGDTASDRHNFDQAAAGNSGHNPTKGSKQAE